MMLRKIEFELINISYKFFFFRMFYMHILIHACGEKM